MVAEGAPAAVGTPPTQGGLTAPGSASDNRRMLWSPETRACVLPRVLSAYNRLIAEYGFAREASTVAAAWNQGDREAATRAVTDDMIEANPFRDRPQCREKIEAYRESGIDLPNINPFARGPESKAVFETLIRSCAPD
ncbi:MAG: hypothetical protein CM1200mP20_08740 [Pseudomonadota bacterium]|nr:MAG: hypothetical protein CM1200mP20_08740 [Pseudomonadota bacterium]